MEKRRFGRTDMEVSVLGLGGAEIGYENVAPETTTRMLDCAREVGINVIDTAECYRNSEELIGQALGGRRHDFFIFTKVGHPHGNESGANWSRDSILQSIERSLQRLGTDHVDVVHLHSCSEAELKKGEAIAALQSAKEKGHIRYLGYSGDGHAARFAVECGAFDTLQTSVNIADQEAIDLTLPIAQKNNMGVIAKRPVANAAWKTGHKPIDSYSHEYWERLRKLSYEFLHQSDLEQSVATALRFTLAVPGVHTAIVGTGKAERLAENAQMLASGSISPAQFQAIRQRWEEIAPRTWVGQI